MKSIYNKCKKSILILMMMLCMGLVVHRAAVPTYAYTKEEIEAAKSWLSANGYSPDMGGAQAAYNDYMNGKFGAIPGLPEPNNVAQPPADTPQQDPPKEEAEEKPEKDKPEKDESEKDKPAQEEPVQEEPVQEEPVQEEPVEKPDIDSKNEQEDEQEQNPVQNPQTESLPEELVLPNPEQQEFSDMVAVFMEGFSESDQEEISKAQLRLEKQKQERAQAEKEAEGVVTKEHNPQRRIIVILCVVLAMAAIGLVILIAKSKRE